MFGYSVFLFIVFVKFLFVIFVIVGSCRVLKFRFVFYDIFFIVFFVEYEGEYIGVIFISFWKEDDLSNLDC